MIRLYFSRRILVGIFMALAILTGLAIYSYYNTQKLIDSSQWVAHTHDVLYNTERVLAISMDAELGQRGYSLTGNTEFLEPYQHALTRIDEHTKNLQELIKDNVSQQVRIDTLIKQIDQLKAFASSAIEKAKVNLDTAQYLNASMRGKRILDNIRNIVNDIQAEENFLLERRNRETQAQLLKFNAAFTSLIIVTAFVLLTLFFAINFNLKKRIESEQQLKVAMAEIQDLYDNAPCGYHSIDANGYFVDINNTLLHWLGYQKDELLGKVKFSDVVTEEGKEQFNTNFPGFKERGFVYNIEFEFVRKDGSTFPVVLNSIAIEDENGNYVKSRSNTFDNTDRKIAEEKIKMLNQELEAFTYSVSHDLRAPLRSIDGYAKILQEDYHEKLDDEGKRVLLVIMNNAKRMGKLIDDLLDFARVGRKDIALVKVDMTSLVNAIVREVAELEPNRSIHVNVHPLLPAYVDIDMIRQVWINLISNAFKYTGKTASAQIEISSEQNDREVCYIIRDNGVGFDMQYVGKLFGVFQRLHKIQDFSGTGVGLAIIKRIVTRHEGRVWAEGELNQGATFYFTIPNNHGNQ